MSATSSLGIQKYFSGKTIFLTGSTGLIGQLILEKLLRTCPGIKKIYVLIREKKDKTVEERFEELFSNVLFDQVKTLGTSFEKKVVPIKGDNALEHLNISSEDVRKLIDDVNIILHCSANVRFNAPIRSMAYNNVRCTRDLLILAKKMPHLEAFVYVSTAYANCPKKEIGEVIYKPPLTADTLLKMVDSLDDASLEKSTPSLLGDWPNTYVYSKCIAEGVIEEIGIGLPIAIIRPSIVVNTCSEPIEGWTNNIYGPVGIMLAIYLGVVRVFHNKKHFITDMVPGDYVANLIITAAWSLGSRKSSRNVIGHDQIKVYNCVSSPQNPITWQQGIEYYFEFTRQMPSVQMLWYPFCILFSSPTLCHISTYLLHLVPAYIVDFIAASIGRKSTAVEAYKKLGKLSGALEYFTTHQWKFVNENTLELWHTLNSEDKKRYPFDMTLFNWKDHFYSNVRRSRVYILNDPLETLAKAKRKYSLLKIIHYLLVVFLLIVFYMFITFIL